MKRYDCLIIGGGIAGLQAAIQLGRYEHDVKVIDKGYGRSTLCRRYHNVLGWPDGVSGEQLRRLGRNQAKKLGVTFVEGEAVEAVKTDDGFRMTLRSGDVYEATHVLLATGVMDRFPPLPGLQQCLGISIYVCPDCDGYEVKGRRTIVLGSGNTGAGMAITLKYWSDHIIFVNHEMQEVSAELQQKLQENGITVVEQQIQAVQSDDAGNFYGVQLANGEMLCGERGFIAFGGNHVLSDLAKQLGVERLENRHIVTNPRTMETNVPRLYAAGDIAVHAEQVTMAMGEGTIAAIWMHKSLMQAKVEQQAMKEAVHITNG